jgi:cell wall-associated NlpC family hydrolase
MLVVTSPVAHSAHHERPVPERIVAYDWAIQHNGGAYCWGGTGPGCYDCSGLVMEAYEHAGVQLPRTTYEMLSDPQLYQVRNPRRGDLAFFFGGSHVELYDYPGMTFGAHDPAQGIGYMHYEYAWGNAPYIFMRVRGANA